VATAIVTGMVSTSASWLHSATSNSEHWWVGIYNRQSVYSFCGVFADPSGTTANFTAMIAGGDIPPQTFKNYPVPAVVSGANFWGSAESASGHSIRIWEDE